MTRGTLLELRPRALAHNASRARAFAGAARVFAMVKANGYGHGLGLAARAMADEVDGFGVAVLEDALTLRHGGIQQPIMVLQGPMNAVELREAVRQRLELVLHSSWQVALLCQHPPKQPLSVWLKVDTGMHRLGMPVGEVAAMLERLRAHPQIRLAGVMTHFACADMQTDPLSELQLDRIRELSRRLGLPFSAANSAGLCRYPASQGERVRPGIMLYGSSPLESHTVSQLDLTPTQSLRARVIAINAVPKGDTVGYGATWTAPRDSRIAVVSIGYGDGYPRHAPSGTPVAVAGQRAALAGRVSMDLVTVDVTDLSSARVGDEVELWGDLVSVDEVARACGTISYELFCQLTDRVQRVVDGQA